MSLLKRCEGDGVFYLEGGGDGAVLQCHVDVVDDVEGDAMR